MSLRYLIAAFAARVGNPARKLVLLKLADNANDNGICWPSVAHVAGDTELSRDTVKRHIKALENDGYIQVTRRVKDGVNLPSVYELIGLTEVAHGWGQHAPTKRSEPTGGGAESTGGGGMMHPEPSTKPSTTNLPAAALRADARGTGDAAARTPKRRQKRASGIVTWLPEDIAAAEHLESIHPGDRIALAVAAVESSGKSPVPGLVEVALDQLQRLQRAQLAAEKRNGEAMRNAAALLAFQKADPAASKGAAELQKIEKRRRQRLEDC